MQPPREARGAQVAFGCGGLVWPHAATCDRLELERDKTEDVIVLNVEVGRNREPAAYRAARALMRPAAERQAPALDARVDSPVRIEPLRVLAEEPRIPVRRGDVEDHLRVLRDSATGHLRLGLGPALHLRRGRSQPQ